MLGEAVGDHLVLSVSQESLKIPEEEVTQTVSPLRAARSSRLCGQAWRGRRRDEVGKLSSASLWGERGEEGTWPAWWVGGGAGASLGHVAANTKEERPSSTLTGAWWEVEGGESDVSPKLAAWGVRELEVVH